MCPWIQSLFQRHGFWPSRLKLLAQTLDLHWGTEVRGAAGQTARFLRPCRFYFLNEGEDYLEAAAKGRDWQAVIRTGADG